VCVDLTLSPLGMVTLIGFVVVCLFVVTWTVDKDIVSCRSSVSYGRAAASCWERSWLESVIAWKAVRSLLVAVTKRASASESWFSLLASSGEKSAGLVPLQ
jgi:hypothetical protein